MAYAWIIDRDLLAEEWGDEKNNVGVAGPSDAPDALMTLLDEGKGERFRILDDDRIPYYEGRIVYGGDGKAEWYEDFGPLDDFGAPNDGATIIQYQNTEGGWEDL